MICFVECFEGAEYSCNNLEIPDRTSYETSMTPKRTIREF